MRYFLIHLDIAMAFIGIAGFLGKVYEPGPVPSLMTTFACVYFIGGALIYGIYSEWRRKHHRHGASDIMFRECPMYDLKEDDKWTA